MYPYPCLWKAHTSAPDISILMPLIDPCTGPWYIHTPASDRPIHRPLINPYPFLWYIHTSAPDRSILMPLIDQYTGPWYIHTPASDRPIHRPLIDPYPSLWYILTPALDSSIRGLCMGLSGAWVCVYQGHEYGSTTGRCMGLSEFLILSDKNLISPFVWHTVDERQSECGSVHRSKQGTDEHSRSR